MTITELIGVLKDCPYQNTIVSIDGYEGGVTDKLFLRRIKIYPNGNESSYYGEHVIDYLGIDGSETRLLISGNEP